MRPVPDDYGVAYEIVASGPLWSATKNRIFRENLTVVLRSLHDFLVAHQMYVDPDREFPEPWEFEIPRDAVTDKGLAFLWRYLEGYIDQPNPDCSSEYLEACLRHMDG